MQPIIDSHVHAIDPERAAEPSWPPKDSPLYRRLLPRDLAAAMAPATLDSCIVVEASRRPGDDDWLLGTVANDPRVAGVVLNLQPDLSGFAERLNRCTDHPRFLGVRLRPIEHYDLTASRLLGHLRLLEEKQRSIEFGAPNHTLKTRFAELASQFSTTSWILDHCGHPDPESMTDSSWRKGMAAIAASPNTYCKVTGLFAFDDYWRPLLDFLLETFGSERVMFGSNWPVTALPDRLDAVLQRIGTHLGSAAPDFFVHNARRAYGLSPRDDCTVE